MLSTSFVIKSFLLLARYHILNKFLPRHIFGLCGPRLSNPLNVCEENMVLNTDFSTGIWILWKVCSRAFAQRISLQSHGFWIIHSALLTRTNGYHTMVTYFLFSEWMKVPLILMMPLFSTATPEESHSAFICPNCSHNKANSIVQTNGIR